MFIFLDILIWIPIAFLIGELFEKMKLPKLLGYLLFGIFISNIYLFIPIDLEISKHIKVIAKTALTVILLKAGLGISYKTLEKVGKRALLLGSFPNIFEACLIMLLANQLLGFDIYEAGMLGFAISAVSPAVVIPSMTKIQDKGYGEKSGITTMNLASASIDDVFSLTMFAIFLNLRTASGSELIIGIREPISVINGIIIGLLLGYMFARVYNPSVVKYIQYGQYTFVLVLIAGIFFLDMYHLWISLTMGVMMLGFAIGNFNIEIKKYFIIFTNHIWKYAQVFLFFLIGTAIKFDSSFDYSVMGYGILIILLGLLTRLITSYLMLYKSKFTQKEKLFNVFANVPKATVQATVAPLALTVGVVHGNSIVTLAVLSILITAPMGLLLIEKSYKKLLTK